MASIPGGDLTRPGRTNGRRAGGSEEEVSRDRFSRGAFVRRPGLGCRTYSPKERFQADQSVDVHVSVQERGRSHHPLATHSASRGERSGREVREDG